MDFFAARSNVGDGKPFPDLHAKINDANLFRWEYLNSKGKTKKFSVELQEIPNLEELKSRFDIVPETRGYDAVFSYQSDSSHEHISHLSNLVSRCNSLLKVSLGNDEVYFTISLSHEVDKNDRVNHNVSWFFRPLKKSKSHEQFYQELVAMLDAAGNPVEVSSFDKSSKTPFSYTEKEGGPEILLMRNFSESDPSNVLIFRHENSETALKMFNSAINALSKTQRLAELWVNVQESNYDEQSERWHHVVGPKCTLNFQGCYKSDFDPLTRPDGIRPGQKLVLPIFFELKKDETVSINAIHDAKESYLEYLGTSQTSLKEHIFTPLEIEASFWAGQFEDRWAPN